MYPGVAVFVLLGAASTGPITLLDALDRANDHPRVTAAGAGRDIISSREDTFNGSLGNPFLSAMAGPRLSDGGDGLDLQLTLSQPLRPVGTSGAGRRIFRSLEQLAGSRGQAAQLAISRDIGRRWLDVWVRTRDLATAKRAAQLWTETTGRLEESLALQEALESDVWAVRLAHARAEEGVIEAEGALHEAIISLGVLLDRPHPKTTAEIPVIPLTGQPINRSQVSIARHPTLRSLRHSAEQNLAQAEATRVSKQWQFTPSISVLSEGTGDKVLMLSLGAQIPLFNHSEGQVAASEVAAARLERSRVAAERELRAELDLALHEIEHQRARERQLREKVLVIAERYAVSVEQMFEAGQTTVTQLLQTRRVLLGATRDVSWAIRDRLAAELELYLLLKANGAPSA